MASKSAVAVWEWENKQGHWRPYNPDLCQQLERAFSKGLKSVYLGDSDPSLAPFIVYLQPCFQQLCLNTGSTWGVRRELYPPHSPPGRGIRWQWAGDSRGQWHSYDSAIQCFVEEAWSKGEPTVDMGLRFPSHPYIINFCNMTQIKSTTGFVRSVKRIQMQSYPLVKVDASEPLATDELDFPHRLQIPQKPGKKTKSKKEKKKQKSAEAEDGLRNHAVHQHASGSSAKDFIKKLARLASKDDAAISTAPRMGPCRGTLSSSSLKSGTLERRPSLDTISTYLSQDSGSRAARPRASSLAYGTASIRTPCSCHSDSYETVFLDDACSMCSSEQGSSVAFAASGFPTRRGDTQSLPRRKSPLQRMNTSLDAESLGPSPHRQDLLVPSMLNQEKQMEELLDSVCGHMRHACTLLEEQCMLCGEHTRPSRSSPVLIIKKCFHVFHQQCLIATSMAHTKLEVTPL
ncbi:unnamed protein product [Darwinula stevensoni]|uniref:E3 ubiquitin-protein ligase n=1 Tax=Darwinula stevensoni TaxID=69355 RepID=A0A7R9A8M2_9CRUS|nr:unnamed protein product [Darwinula stevensoni]CAG0896598.1 unnamed protein product [Darwinula stevensoni]